MERLPEIMEILYKMNFFQGQRAGRELWNDKPFEVQEEDLENFKRDINTIRSYIWEIVKELKQYRDAEEQGLLLRLPCKYNDSLYWVFDGFVREVWFKGVRCDKGYKPQIIARFIDGSTLEAKEKPIAELENIGKTLFFTKEEAEQALAKMKEV